MYMQGEQDRTNNKARYSAITDDPKYLGARSRSPVERNWAWSPPLTGAVKIIREVDMTDPRCRELESIHERVIADDSILPKLPAETYRSNQNFSLSPHPIVAKNGPTLMQQFGFVEVNEGEVIWQ